MRLTLFDYIIIAIFAIMVGWVTVQCTTLIQAYNMEVKDES